MLVAFKNAYPKRLQVAIMRYDPNNCGGEYGDWATEGWWVLDPGGSANAFWTTNRYAAFYAEADDGAVWGGNRGPVYVYWDAFSSCLNIGSTGASNVVGMHPIDLGPGAGAPFVHTFELR